MSNWTETELAKIATAGDLHISPFREDGVTDGSRTWIWSVVGTINEAIDAAYRAKFSEA